MRLPRHSVISLVRLSIFVASFALAILVKKAYRPWAYQLEMRDVGVANWGPSLFYILGLEMLTSTLITTTGRLKRVKYRTMAGIVAGALAYEISQLFRPDRWFSWSDIVATIAGGLIAILVEIILTNARNKSNLTFTGL